MAKNTNSYTGIDIGKQFICFAQCTPEDNHIQNVGIQPIDDDNPDWWVCVKEGLKGLVSDTKLSGENVVFSLPGEYAVVQKTMLDPDEDDVEGALDWEFSQRIVGQREDYVFDFQRFPDSGNNGANRYLVVGYRGNAVDRVTRLTKTNKLNPIVADLDAFALINAHERNYGDRISQPAFILHADGETAKLILCRDGFFIDFESFGYSAQNESIGDLAQRAIKHMTQMVSDNSQTVSQEAPFYVSGAVFSDETALGEIRGSIQNAEVLNPFRQMSYSESMEHNNIERYAPQLAVAVGLALRGDE